VNLDAGGTARSAALPRARLAARASAFGRARISGVLDAEMLPLCAPRSPSATRVLSAGTA
jgi:hypothetical protein